MAMALRAAVSTASAAFSRAAAPTGQKTVLFSTSRLPFNFPSPPTPAEKPTPADPSTNLFVSGLNKRTTTEGLRTAFQKFGQLVDARVVTDRNSGYSKGFGFVKYTTLEEADAAIKGMDAQYLDGWVIFVEYARPRTLPPPLNSAQNGFQRH